MKNIFHEFSFREHRYYKWVDSILFRLRGVEYENIKIMYKKFSSSKK